MNHHNKEMPRYQCHKQVWALKISSFVPFNDAGGGGRLSPSDAAHAGFEVGADWASRFKPENGDLGYYVVYDDGYASWSPSKAFEEGYTRVSPGMQQ